MQEKGCVTKSSTLSKELTQEIAEVRQGIRYLAGKYDRFMFLVISLIVARFFKEQIVI